MFDSLFPIKKQDLFGMYQKAVASFWTVSECDLQRDSVDIAKLSDAELQILKSILAFFAASDIIVNENIIQNFYNECIYPEAKQFYAIQMGMESIHTHMYNLLIECYFSSSDRTELFHGIETNEHIKNKAMFCEKYMSREVVLGTRLVAYAAVEGIFFCSSFAAIFFFKKRGLLPGLTFSNELISRDESLHAQFSCMLYESLCEDNHIEACDVINDIIREACECEIRFVEHMLSSQVLGFTSSMMVQYVKFMGNFILQMLHCDPIYADAHQPFEFMDMQSLVTKTNFFESRVSEYAKVQSDRVFSLEEDF